MKREVGLWIDHEKAVIVTLTEKGEETDTLTSDVGKHVRFSGTSRFEAAAEDKREHRFEGHLEKYYKDVASRIREATAILILGPGEAKGELRKALEHSGLGDRVVGVETVDKMTDRQLAAAVRRHFRK